MAGVISGAVEESSALGLLATALNKLFVRDVLFLIPNTPAAVTVPSPPYTKRNACHGMSCNAASNSDYHSKEKVMLLVIAAGD